MEKNEFMAIMNKINLAYGESKFPINNDIMNLWYEYFGNCSKEKLTQAVGHYIRTSEYPPTIASIVKEYESVLDQEREHQAEIDRYADSAVSYYPQNRTPEERNEFMKAFRIKCENNLFMAQRLSTIVIDFVKNEELKSRDGKAHIDVPPFMEFLEGIEL